MGQARPNTPKTIEAENFVVRDTSGKVRATFGMNYSDRGGASLILGSDGGLTGREHYVVTLHGGDYAWLYMRSSDMPEQDGIKGIITPEDGPKFTVRDKEGYETEGPGTGSFDAALALVEASHLAAVVDPVPLVSAYIESMTRDDFGLSAHQINASQAGVLYDLATRAGSDLEGRFLDPLDASERLRARAAPDANPFMIADSVAKTLRVHTRILCRAIVAQSDQVPDALVNALVSTVETGALDRSERNQVDSFSAHYETDFPVKQRDRPISADLGML